jgi:hypothetical protein
VTRLARPALRESDRYDAPRGRPYAKGRRCYQTATENAQRASAAMTRPLGESP